jgi:hypothetical protein
MLYTEPAEDSQKVPGRFHGLVGSEWEVLGLVLGLVALDGFRAAR